MVKFQKKLIIKLCIVFLFRLCLEADCMIDAAHDMGVLSADFCNLYHSDRTYYYHHHHYSIQLIARNYGIYALFLIFTSI